MKKIIYLVLISIFYSCNGLLDTVPENSVTFTNFFKTEKDLESVTTQIHAAVNAYLFDRDMMVVRGMLLDEIREPWVKNLRELNQAEVLLQTYQHSWKPKYDIIYLCNTLLENVHRPENITDDRRNFYAGQAYFIKAICYFFIAQNWGDAVISKLTTDVDALPKSSMMEVIDEAIKNGEEAFRILPIYEDMKNEAGVRILTKQYGCKGSAAALLANIYAWKGSMIDLMELSGNSKECYEKSIDYCTEIIDKKIGYYELESNCENVCIKTMKGIDGSDEIIFELQLDETKTYPNNFMLARDLITHPVNRAHQTGTVRETSKVITLELVFSTYSLDDKRLYSYFYYPIENSTHKDSLNANGGYAYLYKWRDAVFTLNWEQKEVLDYIQASWCYWRLADIYLMRAECYAKLNDQRAIPDLNKIRSRAGIASYPAAGDNDLKYAIFREREKELIYEGHRYYDIVRNGLEYINTYLEGNFKTLSLQDIKDGALFIPVGSGAFYMNDLMLQNVYWSRFE